MAPMSFSLHPSSVLVLCMLELLRLSAALQRVSDPTFHGTVQVSRLTKMLQDLRLDMTTFSSSNTKVQLFGPALHLLHNSTSSALLSIAAVGCIREMRCALTVLSSALKMQSVRTPDKPKPVTNRGTDTAKKLKQLAQALEGKSSSGTPVPQQPRLPEAYVCARSFPLVLHVHMFASSRGVAGA